VTVVDDQELMRDSLAETLRRAGYDVDAFAAGREAIERLRSSGADAVVTDLKMPGITGIELLDEVV